MADFERRTKGSRALRAFVCAGSMVVVVMGSCHRMASLVKIVELRQR